MPNAEESEFELPKDRLRPFTLFLFVRPTQLLTQLLLETDEKTFLYVYKDSQVKKTV